MLKLRHVPDGMDQRPILYFTDSAHGAADMVFPSGCFLSAGFYTIFSLCAFFAFSVTDFFSWPDGRWSTFHQVMLDVFWGVLPFMGLVKEVLWSSKIIQQLLIFIKWATQSVYCDLKRNHRDIVHHALWVVSADFLVTVFLCMARNRSAWLIGTATMPILQGTF